MALDALLLETAAAGGPSSLRWYRWSRPTLSLGYFQHSLPESLRQQFRGLDLVQRISGGGAILHHHELTYSLALSSHHPLAGEPRALYDRVHELVIEVIEQAGGAVSLRGEPDASRSSEYLCFSRGDAFDGICRGFKVLGSAQRRRRGAVLQHGSLLLAASAYTPELAGLYDLAPPRIAPDELRPLLEARLAELCGAALIDAGPPEAVLTPGEQRRLRELEAQQSADTC